MKLKFATIDGKPTAYTDRTVFAVQVGRGPKGAYFNRYSIQGDLARAVMYYRGINIGNGYKKRLIMVGAKKPVLARAFS